MANAAKGPLGRTLFAPDRGVCVAVWAVWIERIAVAHFGKPVLGDQRRRGHIARTRIALHGAVQLINQLPSLQVNDYRLTPVASFGGM
jgi:hypothetical protein